MQHLHLHITTDLLICMCVAHLCVHVCRCVYMGTHTSVDTCGGQSLMSKVVLDCSPLYILSQDLSPEPRAHWWSWSSWLARFRGLLFFLPWPGVPGQLLQPPSTPLGFGAWILLFTLTPQMFYSLIHLPPAKQSLKIAHSSEYRRQKLKTPHVSVSHLLREAAWDCKGLPVQGGAEGQEGLSRALSYSTVNAPTIIQVRGCPCKTSIQNRSCFIGAQRKKSPQSSPWLSGDWPGDMNLSDFRDMQYRELRRKETYSTEVRSAITSHMPPKFILF